VGAPRLVVDNGYVARSLLAVSALLLLVEVKVEVEVEVEVEVGAAPSLTVMPRVRFPVRLLVPTLMVGLADPVTTLLLCRGLFIAFCNPRS
jgi:hypothetical protein